MIKFEEAKRGYNKEQVDGYIETINAEYQKLLTEYKALEDELEETENNTSHNEAIASALINAEISKKQIIAKAQFDAKRIIKDANCKIEELSMKRNIILDEIEKLSKILNDILDDRPVNEGECASDEAEKAENENYQ